MKNTLTIPGLMALALSTVACAPGSRGAFDSRTTSETVVPATAPGSGQLGPGYVTDTTKRMYGEVTPTGAENTNGVNGPAGRGETQEHNRLPGTGNRL